ncbi:MAG: Uma2 family endonuclease [Candidatus Entotheonellia bacterium]
MDRMTTAATQVHYPESDGKPMGETDVHIDALIYLREALKDYFRDAPQVYVAGNMLLYYEEGNPAACVAPDVFVVQGVAKGERRTYRLWEEGQPPTVVFEITSRGTRLEDLGTKRALYAMLGVREYFLYDPLGEYLRPSLQGYQLQQGEYERVSPGAEGELVSQALSLELRVEAGRLRLLDPATGERLLTPAEAQAARRAEAEARRTEAAARQAEAAGRQAAEARAALAEAELERLRAELARLRGETS